MRAVVYTEYGGPEVLRVDEIDDPHAEAGQVRIAVRAAGVNPIDWKQRSGMLREMAPVTFPVIDGREAAGVVDEVGAGVDAAQGDEVFGFTVSGAAAEYAILDDFARKPAEVSWEEAAGLPVAVETSTRVFDSLGGVDGKTLVVNGAAGGVGDVAVQLAVARGARVIGTAGERNHDFLRSLGAKATTYGPGLVDRVRALVPDGVDLAFDTAGDESGIKDLIELTGDPGRVATIANFGAGALGVKVTGGTDRRFVEALGDATGLIAAGRLRRSVAATFPFDRAADAHRRSEDGHVRGKLVLVPS
jgi:NADPH:quinone reductase-like Zn-dependent oxidoreductase